LSTGNSGHCFNHVRFGASIFISRADKRNRNGKTLYARRLLLLLIFGFIHGIFFWFGDILSEYALAGLILLLFINKKIRHWLYGHNIWSLNPFVLRILQVTLLPDSTDKFDKLAAFTMDAYLQLVQPGCCC